MRYCLDWGKGKFNVRFKYSSHPNNTKFYTISAGECTSDGKWEWRYGNGTLYEDILVKASAVNYDGQIKGRFQCST